MSVNPQIEDSWKQVLLPEFGKKYFLDLKQFLIEERKKYTILPSGRNIFQAFNQTPFNDLKVVVIGQDPYHGLNQAHGLSFSVQKGVKVPPSLQNIYKELKMDLGINPPNHGCLTGWASQGVFLLNAILTVRASEPASHKDKGWEVFTDEVIKIISTQKQNVVFLLWGKFAQSKAELIDETKHLVLKAAHPSPFAAHRGFFGCKHFSKTNEYLKSHSIKEINWSLA